MENWNLDCPIDSNDSYECRNILGKFRMFFVLVFDRTLMVCINIFSINFFNSIQKESFRKQTIKAYDIKSLLEERYAILSGKLLSVIIDFHFFSIVQFSLNIFFLIHSNLLNNKSLT